MASIQSLIPVLLSTGHPSLGPPGQPSSSVSKNNHRKSDGPEAMPPVEITGPPVLHLNTRLTPMCLWTVTLASWECGDRTQASWVSFRALPEYQAKEGKPSRASRASGRAAGTAQVEELLRHYGCFVDQPVTWKTWHSSLS